MAELPFWTTERVAGLMLLLGDVIVFPGLMMFWIRGGHRGGAPRSHAHYVWERGFIMSAVVPTAVGFVLLAGYFQGTNAFILTNLGATAYLFGGVPVVAAEALSLTLGYEKVYGLIVVYVIVACLAQAAIGSALLLAGSSATWVGWAVILVNMVGLIVLLVFSRRDLYFPVLHHVAPLLIGLTLLWATP
jgi:hypothetical protein